ncbi:ATP-binding cassette domain-containing protein [Bacillaceae bacterium SIJ1]|uniref:ATP-binding cassette domain-containing protein n=1 Tax=Litoribacterium kuwaitense TaxID=1398745 RepID=UPI0013ED2AC2|nr:ATP-binding cassette domain-containing protein [Litoribacterium kuwaitense]NGP45869.1 ATP-binding cassette domain-containing protein [Litoribacterium kuwaitense]
MDALTLSNVTYAYEANQSPVLKNISFSIKKGSWTAIGGPNGSGKSTIARLTNGLLTPQQGGNIQLLDRRYTTTDLQDLRVIRQHVGLLFQHPDDQFVTSSVEEDIAFGLENDAVPSKEMRARVGEILKKTELTDLRSRDPHTLSGGQKQRLALAGLLVRKPSLLVLDEAFSMVDPDGREALLQLIRQENENGMTVLAITHHFEQMLYADRLIWLENGTIVRDGHPVDVLFWLFEQNEADWPVPIVYDLSKALVNQGWLERPTLDQEELLTFLWTLLSKR